METTAVLTLAQIADELGQPPSRVKYVVSKYRLKPVARVGIIRLFSEQQVETIRREVSGTRIVNSSERKRP
jgi:hypothetical protein